MGISNPASATPLSACAALARMSRAEARLAHQLAGARMTIPDDQADAWALRWLPDPNITAIAWLHLRVGGARIALGFESLSAFPSWASLVDAGAPDTLVAACVEMLGQPAWNEAARRTGQAVDVLGFESADRIPPANGSRVGFQLERVGTRMRGVACLQDTAALALVMELGKISHPEDDLPGALDDLPIALAAQLGSTVLSQHELNALQPGDAILVDGLLQPGKSVLRLCAGANATPFGTCEPQGDRAIHITSIGPLTSENQMTQEALNQDPAASNAAQSMSDAIDGLGVELRFEVARWHTTMATLRQLSAGSVVELERPVDGDNVTLWVGNRQVCRGRIMVVGDQLAVQLLEQPSTCPPLAL